MLCTPSAIIIIMFKSNPDEGERHYSTETQQLNILFHHVVYFILHFDNKTSLYCRVLLLLFKQLQTAV